MHSHLARSFEGELSPRPLLRALLQPGIHPCDSIVAQVKVFNDFGKRRQKGGVGCEAFPVLALSAQACTQGLFFAEHGNKPTKTTKFALIIYKGVNLRQIQRFGFLLV